MATVTHYTSFDAALQILLSGKIRFGNIRYCNDKIEIDNLPLDRKDDYFIFCTSEKNIDSLMWFAYAKNKFGACISFNLKKGKQKRTLLKKDKTIGEWNTGNIIYDNNSIFKSGFIKNSIFKREREYRYLCITKNRSVIADINWDAVEDVTLTLSNFFDKSIIESIFSKALVKVNIDIQNYFNV